MSRIVDSKGEAFFCDRSHPDGDFCLIHGDIRIDSKSSTIVMYAVRASAFLSFCDFRLKLSWFPIDSSEKATCPGVFNA